jgi:hypothetical protein
MGIERSFEQAVFNKMSFRDIQYGMSRVMKFSDGNSERESYSVKKGCGFHLSKMCLKEVDKRVKSGLYVPKSTNDREEQSQVYFHPENIRKYQTEPVSCIDIEYCYWTTACNIGAISKEFYDYGLKGGRKWKEGRNASIGSLGTTIFESTYHLGKLINEKHYKRPYNCVRLDVVDKVWDIACEIGYNLGDGIFMFLTDAFYVHTSKEKEVVAKLKDYGYKCHIERGQINEITSRVLPTRNRLELLFSISWNKTGDTGKWHRFSLKNKLINSASSTKEKQAIYYEKQD